MKLNTKQVKASVAAAILYCLFTLSLSANTVAQTNIIKGKVVGVVDGDTITVLLPNGSQQRVRLQGVDAPEKTQASGDAAHQYLIALILDKKVVIEASKRDDDGHIVGKVLLGGRDICLEMIRAGFAWHLKKYEDEQSASDRATYEIAEVEARKNALGLWCDSQPVPPWNFREQQMAAHPSPESNFAIPGWVVFKGRVEAVASSTSLSVIKEEKSRVDVCVRHLEVPLPGQPYADVAKKHLEDLTISREVTVSFTGFSEGEDCLVGDVYINGINLNLQMVRDGVAWCNKNYAYTQGYEAYKLAELAARDERRGLWQDPSPMPPWVYRESEAARFRGYGGGSYGGSPSTPGHDVNVRGYYRRDGTYVRPHTRSAPGHGTGRSGGRGGRSGRY